MIYDISNNILRSIIKKMTNKILSCRTSRKEWATAGERAEIIRHEDNLHMEGQFEVPQTQVLRDRQTYRQTVRHTNRQTDRWVKL